MSILLVNAPTLHENKYINNGAPLSYIELRRLWVGEGMFFYPIEPLGLLSIKAYCESKGIVVHYINAIVNQDKTISETLESISNLRSEVQMEPLIIGLTGASSVFYENIEIARFCKKLWPNAKIIIGGDFASLNYDRILSEHNVFDYACIGDGEILTAALFESLTSEAHDPSTVDGLAYRMANGLITSSSPKATDINNLPSISRDDIRKVIDLGFPASIYTTRGCPYRCTFCTTGQVSSLLDNGRSGYRSIDIESIQNEILMLYNNYSARRFVIVDDLFLSRSPSSKRRANQLADFLISKELDIEYMFDCRLDSVDFDLFKKLHRSGLRQVFIGIENGDYEEKGDHYKKNLKLGLTAVEICQGLLEIGINVVYGMITFDPFANASDLSKTVKLIDALPQQRVNLLINKLIPYPGTVEYNRIKESGLLEEKFWPEVTYTFRDECVQSIYDNTKPLYSLPNVSFDLVKNHLIEELIKINAWD